MSHSTDRPARAATPEPTTREQRIAEETVSAIDYMSRMLGAIEDGRWSYALDKLEQLVRPLERLGMQLSRREETAKGPQVAALVRQESRHYRIGKALYGEPNPAAAATPAPPRPAPLARVLRAAARPEHLKTGVTRAIIDAAAEVGADQIEADCLAAAAIFLLGGHWRTPDAGAAAIERLTLWTVNCDPEWAATLLNNTAYEVDSLAGLLGRPANVPSPPRAAWCTDGTAP
ncbi:hypothetical protein [Nonomuraea ceibae]|uniref:hypothetical protein n=1 Tax=Nonomuraea ceibae TaxID=1935170 RepID=UPI001C5FB161|nr:hypothetical protein [Nonomuraea ceibae]